MENAKVVKIFKKIGSGKTDKFCHCLFCKLIMYMLNYVYHSAFIFYEAVNKQMFNRFLLLRAYVPGFECGLRAESISYSCLLLV